MPDAAAPLHGIVFDFDGIIADSEPFHLRAMQDVLLADLQIALSVSDYYERYLGFDDVGAFRAVIEDHGRALTEVDLLALIARKGRRFEALIAAQPVVFPAATRCVGRLSAAGVPLAIASGALAPEIETILAAAGLRAHFRAIVASGDTPAGKPAPDPYARAIALLTATLPASQRAAAHPSGFVAIEDSHWGLISARAAGLRTIAVTTSYPAVALAAADTIVSSLDEVTIDLIEALCPPKTDWPVKGRDAC